MQTVAGTTERGQLSTHILDTGIGKPASGVDVSLEARNGRSDTWKTIAEGITDKDGRIENLGGKTLPEGAYRITFETEAYFTAQKKETFFPEVTIDFYITDNTQHYHVPLLLSPFAYSTYRGS
ncbi:hydroxyisourate hydrolase [Microbacterium sp. NPDC057650]|uniref:hydroxyisourate hydrolase n=1 Tax=unclassified Microbacterium TaxID=2609290 RepID=UPI00366D78FF